MLNLSRYVIWQFIHLIISHFQAKKSELKEVVILVILVILVAGMMPFSAYSESSNEFGSKLLPEKLLEYTEGTLQVFVEVDNIIIPKGIGDLKATSTDNSIIKIIGIEPANEFITNIKIQALEPGVANIALAAPGFLSKEIPIKVFNSNNFPTQIQMKITPNDFPVDGPKHGYIGIELLTTSGQPAIAENDTVIKFSTPNKDILELKHGQVLIKKGEYFIISEFEIKGSGDPIIFAETEGMKKISEFIHIQKAVEPYKIQVYTYPSDFTSYTSPTAYLIVQIQDDDGVPIVAEKDIHVSITASNPDSEINTSIDFDEVIFGTKKLTIESGSYWTYTSFTTRPNIGDFTDSDFQTYAISVSADDYLSSSSQITVVHERVGGGETGTVKGGILIGEGPATFSDLPFLTTGKKELIGVVYLEAAVQIVEKINFLNPKTNTIFASITGEVTLPVMASKDIELNIASSSLNTVDFINPVVKQGTNSALVFGNTGTIAPKDCSIEFYLTDNNGITTIAGEPFGPVKESLSLTVEQLIPMILAETNFPVLGYLMESDESDDDEGSCYESASAEDEDETGRFGATQFTEDTILTFSANEYAEIEPVVIKQNQPYALITVKSNKVGSTTFDIRGSDLESQFQFTSHTTDPTSFGLAYAETTLPDTTTLLAIQILDSSGNPVYAKNDIEITLVSNDESVMEVPNNLVILKGEYRTIFEINTLNEGNSEIAILSEDLPLSKYKINVKGIHPDSRMSVTPSPALIDEEIQGILFVSYPGINLSPEGLDVEWIVTGADIITKDSVTNENGQALINIISQNPGAVTIKAIVNGIGIQNAEAFGNTDVVVPEGSIVDLEPEDSGLLGLVGGFNMIFFIIPGAIAAVFLFLKRTNRLEEINLGEKFEDIKERVAGIRER